ncbi:MAG: primosomal replication protein N [Zoogloeaceae bacterium]|nr:primosomal replication protein N [Zoogloeaceae bacterium]
MNQLDIRGRIVEKKALRYTPSGIPAMEARLAHVSEVMEAGLPRTACCEVPLLAFGTEANRLAAAPPETDVKITGFLAAKGRNSKTLVLHVQTLEFLEGTHHGQILQEEG